MSTTHTKGPWRLHESYAKSVISENGFIICNTAQNNAPHLQYADAIRIVQCVNAMEGIQDPSNHRATWDAIKHLELDKYQELKKVVQDVVRLIDEGRELTPDSIIVKALRHGIK